MFHSILRNFSAFGVAFVVDRIVTFFYLVYAARVFGPDVFGQFLLVGTYVMFFSMTFNAGLLPVALREIARQRDDPLPVLEQVLSLRLILGMLAYLVLLFAAAFVLTAPVFLPLAAVAGTALIIDAFRDSFTAYHTAFERMIIPSVFQTATAILTAACGSILLLLDFSLLGLLTAAALINLGVTAVWHVLFVRRCHRYRIRLAFSAWKQMLIMAAPVAPLQLAHQLNRLANVLLLSVVAGPLSSERAVGYYGPAQQIANFPFGLLFGLRRAMVPPVADKIGRGERIDDEFSLSLKIAVVFLSFPMLVITSVFAEEILLVVFGAGYLQSALPLKFLGGAAAIAMAASFPETFMVSYPERRASRFLPGAVVPLIINGGLCLALIPAYGPSGAACAILIARGANLGFALHYCRMLLPMESLGIARMWPTFCMLGVAYAGCLWADAMIVSPLLRNLTITILAVSGPLAAGYRELGRLWTMITRRAHRVA